MSLLASHQAAIAAHFADNRRNPHTQFDDVPCRRTEPSKMPMPAEATAWLECRTVAVHPAGDHSILVGEVLWAATGADDAASLLYFDGGYGAIGRHDGWEPWVTADGPAL